MSHWDPNRAPPPEGYQYFNQSFNPSTFYNAGNEFENLSYNQTPEYSPSNQMSVDLFMSQFVNNSDNRLTNSTKVSRDQFPQNFSLQATGNTTSTDITPRQASTSTLTATAKEFHPSASLPRNLPQENQQHGAVKKSQNYKKNKYVQDHGNSSYRNSWGTKNTWQKSGYNERNDNQGEMSEKPWHNKKQNNRTSQQSQVLEEAKMFMKKLNVNGPNEHSENTQSEYFNRGADSDKHSKNHLDRGGRFYRKKNFNEDYRGNNEKYEKRDQYNNSSSRFNESSYSRKDDTNFNNYARDNRKYDRAGTEKGRFRYRDTKRFSENTDRQDSERENKNSEERYLKSKPNVKEDNKLCEERRDKNTRNNWRSSKPTHQNSKPEVTTVETKAENRKSDYKKRLDAASQRERLEEMVTRKLLECLVCCEKIRNTDEIWSCLQCYHILHLNCIIRWAKASKLDSGWRCPACQNVNNNIPKEYLCYCTKVTRPILEPGSVPHSCGELCSRKGRSCEHTCTLLCHPGPCPDCSIMVKRSCSCGKTTMMALCSAVFELVCKNDCNKLLECGLHYCKKVCHTKECDQCPEFLKQECYCGKVGRKVRCTKELEGATEYECGEVCGKLLDCENHYCKRLCHPGKCEPCEKAPDRITHCPCNQTVLIIKRTSCLDKIPCCDKICNKPLKCGQPSFPHKCQHPCHEGPCPPCPLTTLVRCRCGHMDREITCIEVKTKADDARCEKRCTKKRQCCKHKCNQLCCIDLDHMCPLICNHVLSCGQHRCEETCHRGRCPPCWRTSFQELYCECGSSVLYPPVACGTRPPPCSKPCSRPRECGHQVNHNCHPGPCPPCTVLAVRWCYGKHEQRSTIPCHQGKFSCGMSCGKEMLCGRHKCIQPCHTGPCPSPCSQPCTVLRDTCSHPCNAPCHNPPCQETPCKQIVKVTCQCGLRSSTRPCMELAGEYQFIAMSQLATKMADIQRGQTVDISDIVSSQKKPSTLKTLECNEECRIVERNRRLTIGLQIRNPDLSSKLTPRYSDYMKSWAKKDSRFCQTIHDKLSELVQLSKQSKQKSRSHSFESMNRDKRHFVHEYCEHFGCESAAYDQEPNRNVVATAFRDKSWLPSLSLLEVIQRENGQRKVPGPVLSKSCTGISESFSLNKLPGRVPRPTTPPGEFVDYFNDPS